MSRHLPGRPAIRRNEIMDFIHGKIISGQFKPGERLPIRRNLQRKFNSSMVTVQQAVDRLVSEGFVESRGVGGTYVSSNPPHLNQYAVVVPAANLDHPAPLFWRTLVDAFAQYGTDSSVFMKHCYWPTEQGAAPEGMMLARSVTRRSIAGMVFVTPPLSHETEKIELVNSGSVPCVMILSRKVLGKFKSALVSLDDSAFIRKALDHFVENGRRKVALITSLRGEDWWRDFHAAVAEKGVESRPYWTLSVSHETKDNARNLANLLMQLPKGKLPDALLITDDNLARPVLVGLADSGSVAARNLCIISHANFPAGLPMPPTVKLLGYDSRQVVEACMRALARQHQGESPVEVCEDVSPIFEDERQEGS